MVSTGVSVTPSLQVIDLKSGRLTREGFLLLTALNDLLNGITAEIGAELIENTITDGVTSKAPSSNAVFDALALKASTVALTAGLATKQDDDATLTALAALDGTAGHLVVTALNTFARRTITGTANQVSVSNGAGTAGNPTLSLAVGNLLVGSWTPTLTGTANVDATTALVSYYARIGTHVICWGAFQVDPTAAGGTNTQMRLSLPIASNFAANTDLRGNANTGVAQQGGVFVADTTNDEALLIFASETTANTGFSFIFGYQII